MPQGASANPSLAAAAPQNTSAEGTFPSFWETDTKQGSQSDLMPANIQKQLRLQEGHLETTTALPYNHSHSFRGSFLPGKGARLVGIVTAAQGTSHSQRHSCEVTSHLEPDQRFLSTFIHSSEAGWSRTLVWDIQQSNFPPLTTSACPLTLPQARQEAKPSSCRCCNVVYKSCSTSRTADRS